MVSKLIIVRSRSSAFELPLNETISLIRRKTRISAKQVAETLGCAEKTVQNGGAGTLQLTRIRNGTRQLRFLEEEVLALAQQQEENARASRHPQDQGPQERKARL
jgi:hypothetical protein